MKRFALIGKKLGHSYSQQYFEGLFKELGLPDHSYRLHEMASLESLRDWIREEGICGFNVTVPYKQAIVPLLDRLDPVAEAVGAVNCVTVEGDMLTGHNTDAPAFLKTLGEERWNRALILGTGGAAQAVAYALRKLGVPYTFVSRKPEEGMAIGYGELRSFDFSHPTLIVNATPVGMFPDTERNPWPCPEVLNGHCMVYDLTYNPSPTLLMRQAAAQGAKTKDGLEMLHLQAALSWELYKR